MGTWSVLQQWSLVGAYPKLLTSLGCPQPLLQLYTPELQGIELILNLLQLPVQLLLGDIVGVQLEGKWSVRTSMGPKLSHPLVRCVLTLTGEVTVSPCRAGVLSRTAERSRKQTDD